MKKNKDKPSSNQKISFKGLGIMKFHDPSIMKKQHLSSSSESKNNPVAEKYYFLIRTGDESVAKRITPDTEAHNRLIEIIQTPDFTSLKLEDSSFMWKYRYSIKNDETYSKGIVKFLKSVKWNITKEANEAMEMLVDWEFSQEQALSMLSAIFSANNIYAIGIAKDKCKEIRAYAVKSLDKSDTNTLKLILLELAQAYRYEEFENSMLKEFFLIRAVENESIAHKFYWIIKLEKDNQNNLQEIRDEYEILFNDFLKALEAVNPEYKLCLEDQLAFRDKLLSLSSYIKTISGVTAKKNELKRVISKGGMYDLMEFKSTPMPLDPSIEVCGIVPEKCSVFPSAMWPLKLTFLVNEKTKNSGNPRVDGYYYNVMFKQGDDVRQDQLVLQMIDLMDFLLK